MSIYTVHESPRGDGRRAERFKFVRDGFHWWALLLAPLWMLWHRLWLVFIIYIVGIGATDWFLARLGFSAGAIFLVNVMVLLLIGFEASTLRRWTLARRKWRLVDVVSASSLEAAEWRFFEKRGVRAPDSAAAASPPPVRRRAPGGSDIVGLFPESGART